MSESNDTGLQTSDTCTITISGPGKPVTAELPNHDARTLGELAELLSKAPRRTPLGELSPEEIGARTKRDEQANQDATVVLSQLSELAALNKYEMRLVLAYVQLIRFGDRALCSEENWILEVINGLLEECVFSGIGGALAEGPIVTLRTLVNSYGGFQGSIENAHDAAKAYPQLFRDPSADAEMAESIIALEKAVSEQKTTIDALTKKLHRAVVSKKRGGKESKVRRVSR
ncbi:MAG TPA: hypothetical protein VNV82_13135 [Bryobacteraceae bacterium]|jgi:hypothetical protein|nr:hypothetical protein [Bryobacteraceae bacterium]